jgi:sulfite oxidase
MFKYRNIIGGSFAVTSMGLSYIYNKHIYTYNKKLYTYEEVSKYNNMKEGIWVTYKDNVYDITNFIESHPGGKDKILLSAGKALDPYWKTYKQHTNNPDIIKNILDPMKIGILKDYDENKYQDITDPYTNDPIRDPDLNFHSISPCIAETPKNSIMENWITPNELWYIRNYHPVPNIDPVNYKLNIFNNDSKISFSIDDLKKLKNKKIISTIQCGGNRRGELNLIDKTIGTHLNFCAISNAEWEGVTLRDLLILNKVTDEQIIKGDIKHIQFEAIDGLKTSIPAEKAMNIYGDVLIAYKMNGEDIPRDHGYPLRLIAPGHIGIRNIKWLKNIKVSTEESDGTWQRGISYKGLPHYIKDFKNLDLNKFASVQEMPVQSCIVDVNEKNDTFNVQGFAWSGGGRGIIRVDVSIDGGTTWHASTLKEGSEQNLNKSWAWTFWKLELNSSNLNLNLTDKIKIICKATDSSYNTQPEKSEFSWNIRGLNNNSWHTVDYK